MGKQVKYFVLLFFKKWYYECMGDITIPSEEKGWFVMKALSFSRLMFVLGLTLGIMVLLAGVSPTVLNANSLTGGAWPTCPGGPCFEGTDGTEDCGEAQTGPGAPPGSLGCDGGQDLVYCVGHEDGPGACTTYGTPPCPTPSLGDEHPCNVTLNMSCEQ